MLFRTIFYLIVLTNLFGFKNFVPTTITKRKRQIVIGTSGENAQTLNLLLAESGLAIIFS